MDINNNQFLKYLIKNERSNLRFIQKLRVNKKSITIYIEGNNTYPIFNDFFTEKRLHKIILNHLARYTKIDRDCINYRFKKLNIIQIENEANFRQMEDW